MTRFDNTLKKAVLKTFIYSSLFDFPLTGYEVYYYLIELQASQEKVREILSKAKLVSKKDDYFFLNDNFNLVSKRIERKSASQQKWKIADKASRLLSCIPTIQVIGVTGGLAMNNADKEDDIDFLIIAYPGFLWITRFFSTILLDFFGLRRKPHQKNVKDLICLNMFLDTKHLGILLQDQNLYLAHEVLQMTPLLNRNHTYEYFLGQNKWVEKFLPNCWNVKNSDLQLRTFSSHKFTLFLSALFYPLENFLYILQKKYMEKNMTSEKVNLHHIEFHPGNFKEKILSIYSKKTRI